MAKTARRKSISDDGAGAAQVRAHSWPAEAQAELERMAREIEAEIGSGSYRPTPEELTGIERGLADVAAGRFVTDEQVEAAFARHRRA